ncbi:MAG: type II toxin-antitoxin system PemK/MazF family toxin [Actinomycetota bacterium]
MQNQSLGPPKRGELCRCQFPYSEDPTVSKARPVCVVSSADFNSGSPDVLVAKITSSQRRLSKPGTGDVPLIDWVAAGLPLKSVFRAGSIFTVTITRLSGPFGFLSPTDLEACEDALRLVLELPSLGQEGAKER